MPATIKLEHSAQRTLFGGLLAEVEDPAEKDVGRGNNGPSDAASPPRPPVRFIDRNPETILVGEQRLRDFLKDTDQQEVIYLREFLRSLDWSEFEARYRSNGKGGRPPYHPAVMVGVILLGFMSGRNSLRALEKLARRDVGAWWLTGGIYPDHSAFGRFVNLHAETLTDSFFVELTTKVVEATGCDLGTLSGDGTVVQAAASQIRTLRLEAAETAAEKARTKSDKDPDSRQKQATAELAEKTAKVARERARERKRKGRDPATTRVSPTEPEAMLQPLKRGGHAPSYKPSVLATTNRIVVGHNLDPANEPVQVEPMLDQANRVAARCGEPPASRLLLDAGYFCALILRLALRRGLDLLCPEGKNGGLKCSRKYFPKSAFVYDEVRDVYRCPAGEELRPRPKAPEYAAEPSDTLYRGAPCADCRLRSQCTKAKRGRTIRRTEHDDLKDAQRLVMSQPRAQEAYKPRMGAVEPVFSELREVQGLRRFRRRGPAKARLEFALHALAHNTRKYLPHAARNGADVAQNAWFYLRRRLSAAWCVAKKAIFQASAAFSELPRNLRNSSQFRGVLAVGAV